MDLHEHFLNNQEEAEAIANHNRLLLEHENREQERILKYRGQMEKKSLWYNAFLRSDRFFNQVSLEDINRPKLEVLKNMGHHFYDPYEWETPHWAQDPDHSARRNTTRQDDIKDIKNWVEINDHMLIHGKDRVRNRRPIHSLFSKKRRTPRKSQKKN